MLHYGTYCMYSTINTTAAVFTAVVLVVGTNLRSFGDTYTYIYCNIYYAFLRSDYSTAV